MTALPSHAPDLIHLGAAPVSSLTGYVAAGGCDIGGVLDIKGVEVHVTVDDLSALLNRLTAIRKDWPECEIQSCVRYADDGPWCREHQRGRRWDG